MALLPAMAFAEHVEPTRAQKVAKTFLSNNDVRSAQLTDVATAAGFSNLYIFNANPGFVVMAADDCVQPILGYSFRNPVQRDGFNPELTWWLNGYQQQIDACLERGKWRVFWEDRVTNFDKKIYTEEEFMKKIYPTLKDKK